MHRVWFPSHNTRLRLPAMLGCLALLFVAGCESSPESDSDSGISARSLSVETNQKESALESLALSDCCYSNTGAGCEVDACSLCVCKDDPHCCDVQWDSHCVTAAASKCTAECLCSSGCTDPPGDVNGTISTNILDVQCGILALLAEAAASGAVPPCLANGLSDADINCDGSLNVTDTQALTLMALQINLPSGLDSNENGCPDACEYTQPNPCLEGEDGDPCDDGNRCTEEDQCLGGICVGGPPPDCDDGNPCTTDQCNEVLGCRTFANSDPCELAGGTGVCIDKLCWIENCPQTHGT